MKKLLVILLGLFALTACDDYNDNEIDLSLVTVEIELECIAEEVYSDRTDHTFLCTGTIGGFTGPATIYVICYDRYISSSHSLVVAGGGTTFSFTFTGDALDEYDGTPQTFDISIEVDGKKIFQSSVVITL